MIKNEKGKVFMRLTLLEALNAAEEDANLTLPPNTYYELRWFAKIENDHINSTYALPHSAHRVAWYTYDNMVESNREQPYFDASLNLIVKPMRTPDEKEKKTS